MRGFTLFESLIYIALFALLMSGALMATQSFEESADRSRTRALLEMEGDFILAKISSAPTEYEIVGTTIDHVTKTGVVPVSSPVIAVSGFVQSGQTYSFTLTAQTSQGEKLSQMFSATLPTFP